MDLCSKQHEEVAFDGSRCPFCQMIEEKDTETYNLGAKLEEQDAKIEELEEAAKRDREYIAQLESEAKDE